MVIHYYLQLFNTGFSYIYVFSLTIILSVNLLMQYNFSLTLRTLLNADKKVYIVSLLQAGLIFINIILAIVSVKIYPSIHLLKVLTSIAYIIQPLIYRYFVNKYFNLDKKAKMDKDLLKSRWNGFAINIAAFIHFNTDIAILTVFTDLKTVSIYSIYKLVTNGINQLINAVASALSPSIGHLYASGNKEELEKKFDIYEFTVFILVFGIYTVAALLITPFVMIYTNNISDANYYQPLFGILIILAEGMYVLKSPHVNLAYSANKFKEMTIPAYIEAGLNIIVSIILVQHLGLLGVAIGTLIAMTYRTLYQVIFLKKIIINRTLWKFFKKVIVYGITSALIIFISINFIPSVEFNIVSWVWHAIIYTIIMIVLYYIVSKLFYKNELKKLFKFIKK